MICAISTDEGCAVFVEQRRDDRQQPSALQRLDQQVTAAALDRLRPPPARGASLHGRALAGRPAIDD
jgi:hypothetical protein